MFLEENSPPFSGLDKLLYRFSLVGVKELSFPIEYDGQTIGVLKGEKYVRMFYPLMNIFFLLLFSVLVTAFVVYLFFNRKILEQKVEQRTQEFLESEDCIRMAEIVYVPLLCKFHECLSGPLAPIAGSAEAWQHPLQAHRTKDIPNRAVV